MVKIEKTISIGWSIMMKKRDQISKSLRNHTAGEMTPTTLTTICSRLIKVDRCHLTAVWWLSNLYLWSSKHNHRNYLPNHQYYKLWRTKLKTLVPLFYVNGFGDSMLNIIPCGRELFLQNILNLSLGRFRLLQNIAQRKLLGERLLKKWIG